MQFKLFGETYRISRVNETETQIEENSLDLPKVPKCNCNLPDIEPGMYVKFLVNRDAVGIKAGDVRKVETVCGDLITTEGEPDKAYGWLPNFGIHKSYLMPMKKCE